MVRTVIHFTDNAIFGGAEQVLLQIVVGLDRQRWRPVVLHYPEPGLAPLLAELRRHEIQAIAVPPMVAVWHTARHLSKFMGTLRSLRPAVFHAHQVWPLSCKYGLYGAMLARVPAVVATQHLFVNLPYTRLQRLQQRLLNAGLDRAIAVSDEVGEQFRRVYGVPARKLVVIHNGIPLGDFAGPPDPALRAAVTGGDRRPVILTAARLHPQKGHRYLLEAAARVPDAFFVIAGDGPERAALEAQAAALGVTERVRFLGFREDIAALLAACDLFALPSLYEGHPIAVLEAMAAGKAVVTSAIGGTDEAIVDGETGLLVPPADPAALAAALRALLDDQALRVRLGAAGRERATRVFSAATMARRTERLYDEILDPRAGYRQ